MKRLLSLLLALTLSLSLAACGTKTNSASPAAPATDGAAPASTGSTEIIFWHATGGVNGELLEQMVEDFNTSQDKIKVVSQFQGRYEDALTKLKSAMQSGDGPDVCQVYDVGTKFMIDSKVIVPMEDFLGDTGFNKGDIEKNLLSYYSANDKLQAMPFNSSTPILFYNKDAFKAAGLDPEKPPKTFVELKEYARKMTIKDGDRVAQYGFATPIYGWFYEQMIAGQAKLYSNNENGRGADDSTVVEFDKNGAGLKAIEVWRDLVDSGVAGNFGRKVDDTKNAFIAGKAAMTFLSTAQIVSLDKAIGGRFEMGTGYMPQIDGTAEGGIVIGGGSLWVLDSKNDAKKDAAWEFTKYMVSPEVQSKWAMGTGYFAVNNRSYELPEMTSFMDANPNFRTAVEQLQQNPSNTFTQGALLGVFPEARVAFEENMEKAIMGQLTNEQCLEEMVKKINGAIDNYNKTK